MRKILFLTLVLSVALMIGSIPLLKIQLNSRQLQTSWNEYHGAIQNIVDLEANIVYLCESSGSCSPEKIVNIQKIRNTCKGVDKSIFINSKDEEFSYSNSCLVGLENSNREIVEEISVPENQRDHLNALQKQIQLAKLQAIKTCPILKEDIQIHNDLASSSIAAMAGKLFPKFRSIPEQKISCAE